MEIKLKSDKSHKKCNLQGIKGLPLRLTSMALGLVLLTGCNTSKSNTDMENIEEDESSISYSDLDDSSKEPYYTIDSEPQETIEEEDEDIIPSDIDLDEVVDVGEYFAGNLTCWFEGKKTVLDTKFYDKNGEEIESKDKMTVRELLKIRKIGGIDVSEHNCDWLNYCMNLEELTLVGSSEKKELVNVKGENLKKLKKLTIYDTLSEENSKFIYKLPNLKTLEAGYGTKWDFEKLKELKTLKKLTFNTRYNYIDKNDDIWGIYYDYIDFRQFAYLDNLKIYGSDYDLPIYLSNDDIQYLKDANVNIIYVNLGTDKEVPIDEAEQLKENNDKLDEMVKELNLEEDATDDEKLHAIVEYMLTNYSYDPNISYKNSIGESLSQDDYDKFYGKEETYGHLYGFLKNKKKTLICANFTAGVRALGHRVDLEAHRLDVIGRHTYSMVKVDDAYYYVDLAFLEPEWENTPSGYLSADEVFDFDSVKLDDYAENFDWYKADPTEYPGINDKSSVSFKDHDDPLVQIEIDYAENHKKIEEAKEDIKETTESEIEPEITNESDTNSEIESEMTNESDTNSKTESEMTSESDTNSEIESEMTSESDTNSETESELTSKSEREIKKEAYIKELREYLDEYILASENSEDELYDQRFIEKSNELYLRMEKDNIAFTEEDKRIIVLSGFIRDDELVNYLNDRYKVYEEENEKELMNKKIPIKLGGKIIITSIGALLGTFAGISTLKKYKNKNKRKINTNAINNINYYNYNNNNNNNYSNNYRNNNQRRHR